jgi:DNA repair protein RecO (recombination protein O)
MILQQRTEGFIFKKEDRLEADRVLSIFTKDFGRIEVLARAVRKINAKLRTDSEIFSFCEIEFVQGKNKKTLTDAKILERFSAIKKSPEKLEIAYWLASLLQHFIKGQESDRAILDLIYESFSMLNDIELQKRELVFEYFFWNFISLLGYSPELSVCLLCRKSLSPQSMYFSFSEGGVICNSCFADKHDKIKITSDVVKFWRLFLKKDWNILLRLKIEQPTWKLLKEVSRRYYHYLASHILSLKVSGRGKPYEI